MAKPVKILKLNEVSDGFELIVDDKFFNRLFGERIDTIVGQRIENFVNMKIAEAEKKRKYRIVKLLNKVLDKLIVHDKTYYLTSIAVFSYMFITYFFYIYDKVIS